jgi:hypothetical protein
MLEQMTREVPLQLCVYTTSFVFIYIYSIIHTDRQTGKKLGCVDNVVAVLGRKTREMTIETCAYFIQGKRAAPLTEGRDCMTAGCEK